MKFVLDCHLHTIASGHAYSTIHDIVEIAKKNELQLIGLTDHGPDMPGASNIFHIGNQRVIPDVIDGIKVLKGVEANIINAEGHIDIPDSYMAFLDIVIASLHDVVWMPVDEVTHTDAVIKAMKQHERIDIIGHPGNPRMPIEMERFVKAAKEYDKIIEINNSSFVGIGRAGSKERCFEIAKLAKKYDVKVIAGSDAHISYQVGKLDKSMEIIQAAGISEERVMNTSVDKLVDYLNAKGRNITFDYIV